MFSFRQAFALVSVSLAFHLVMTAPILISSMEPAGEEGGGGIGQTLTENRKIDGKDVKLTLLSGANQSPAASTYALSSGWDGNLLQAAIVRIWKTQDTKLLDTIETSVDFLKDPAVGLLYHSEKNALSDADPKEYEYVTVMKAMRQNYPTQGAPELARLYKWFNSDKAMDLAAATEQVRKAAITKAEDMAKQHNIVFRGIDARTVWTNKEREVVYFDTYSDAVHIKGDLDSDEAKAALEQMRKNAEENYTEANIRKAAEP